MGARAPWRQQGTREEARAEKDTGDKATGQSPLDLESTEELRLELVAHFRNMREPLRRQWVEAMTSKGLTEGQTEQETETESKMIYDTCIDCLETAEYTSAEIFASAMAERGVLRGMSPGQIIGGILTLHDVLGRGLFEQYQNSVERLSAAHDIYDPVASAILTLVVLASIQEHDRVVNQQQEAILGLSTPVLQLRHGSLILPIVGFIDSQRAQQLIEQLLEGIRITRARVVVIDITGVPDVDSRVANHLLQTVDASGLMGASAVFTGLSPEVAQTLVSLGIDLGHLTTIGDLQGGIEEADQLLGYKTLVIDDGAPHSEGQR